MEILRRKNINCFSEIVVGAPGFELEPNCGRLSPQAKSRTERGTSPPRVVGAPGFEPGTSCAQGRRTISWKSFLFNLCFENKRVREIFGSGTMCRNVAAHAWSPPNFPHSEITAKVHRSGSHFSINANPSFENRRGVGLLGPNVDCLLWRCHRSVTQIESGRAWI